MADPCTLAALDVPADSPLSYDGLTFYGVSAIALRVVWGCCRLHRPALTAAAPARRSSSSSVTWCEAVSTRTRLCVCVYMAPACCFRGEFRP